MSRDEKPHSVFNREDLDDMLAGMKEHLQKAARGNPPDQDQLLERTVYMINDSDVQWLLCYILDASNKIRKKRRSQETAFAAAEVVPAAPVAPRPVCPVAPMTVCPTTTTTMPEEPSTSADDADGKGLRRAQAATITTMVSRDSVIGTTWLQSEDAASAIGAGSKVTFLPSTSSGTPDPAEQTSGAERTTMAAYQAPPCSDTRASVDSRYSVRVDYSTGCSIGNDTRKRRRSSTMASVSEGEPDLQQESRAGEESDLPTTALGKMRKRSFQFGEAVGSFINGAYWNADHKPRRDSSVVRMRGILDRLQPPRPKPGEGQDIYTAFTGARPITPVDQYNARTKRPGPSSDTCSEDGRRHKCVQHETDTPPG